MDRRAGEAGVGEGMRVVMELSTVMTTLNKFTYPDYSSHCHHVAFIFEV